MKISGFKTSFKRNPAKFLLLGLLVFLPFLDGGTNLVSEYLLFFSPLPLLVFLHFKRKPAQRNFRFTPLPVLFFAFLILVALSLPGSISLAASIPAFFKMLSIFLLFSLALFLFDDQDDLKRLIQVVLIVALGLSLLSLHYLLPWAAKPPSPLNLVYAYFGHNHLADYLVFALPFALSLFLAAKKGKQVWTFGLASLFFFAVLLSTFSRAALLFLPAIALLSSSWLPPGGFLKKTFILTLIIVPSGMLLLITSLSLSPTGVQVLLATPGSWLIRQLVKPPFQEKRFAYWQEAVTTVASYPLTGSGLATFKLDALRFQPKPESWSAFAHNHFLDVAAETGALAFFVFVSFVWLGLKKASAVVLEQKNNPLVVGAFLGLLYSLAQALLDWNWQFPAIFITFLALLAALVNQAREKSKAVLGLPRFFWPLMAVLSLTVFLFGLSLAALKFFSAQKNYAQAVNFYPWDGQNYRDYLDSVATDSARFGQEAKRYSRLNRQDGSAHRFLGAKYQVLGQPESAVAELELAALYNPLEDPGLYAEIADLYRQLDYPQKAKKTLLVFDQHQGGLKNMNFENLEKEVSYEFRKSASEVYYRLAQIYFEEGDHALALSFLVDAVRFDSWVLNHFAPLPAIEAPDEALVDFAMRLEEVDEQFMAGSKRYYAKVFYLAGLEFLQREEFDQAASFWQKTVRLTPEWSQFWRELGGLYLFLGDFEKAGEVFAQCLETASGDPGCASGARRASWQKNWPERPGHLKGEILAIPD